MCYRAIMVKSTQKHNQLSKSDATDTIDPILLGEKNIFTQALTFLIDFSIPVIFSQDARV